MKRILLLISGLALLCMASNCDSGAEEADRSRVNSQQELYATNQPVPMFKWSQDRDNLIQIYKMKNESRTTYSVVRAAGTGEILWHCPSIGFPIPADTQITNPLQVMYQHGGVIEQAEPNGLFTSKNTDGTYVICVLPDGSLAPQYTEQKAEVFTRPVKIELGKVVFVDGAATMVIQKHN
jgi:hypothetical protein